MFLSINWLTDWIWICSALPPARMGYQVGWLPKKILLERTDSCILIPISDQFVMVPIWCTTIIHFMIVTVRCSPSHVQEEPRRGTLGRVGLRDSYYKHISEVSQRLRADHPTLTKREALKEAQRLSMPQPFENLQNDKASKKYWIKFFMVTRHHSWPACVIKSSTWIWLTDELKLDRLWCTYHFAI